MFFCWVNSHNLEKKIKKKKYNTIFLVICSDFFAILKIKLIKLTTIDLGTS
jgi:hypothetical protein